MDHQLSRVASLSALLFGVALVGCGGTFTADDQDAGAAGSTTSGGSGGSATGGGTGTGTGGSAGSATGSGGAGTGGSTGTGGAGTGGSTGTGGGGPPITDCTTGTVQFHMSEAAGADYCVGVQCTMSWVSVKSMTGVVMPISGGCQTTCSACMPIACAGGACIAPQHMKPAGESLTWNGSFFVQSKCGAGVSCRDMQCAPPGKYIATMCANRSTSDAGINGFCMADQTPTCVDVPFDFPSATVVEGVIGR